VVLECVISAVPTATHYWTRDSLPIGTSTKYEKEEFDELDGHVTLRLVIHNLTSTDYSDYQCVAGNQLGKTHKTVTLYGSLAYSFTLATLQHYCNSLSYLYFDEYDHINAPFFSCF